MIRLLCLLQTCGGHMEWSVAVVCPLQGCVCSAGQADFGGGVGVPVGTAGVAVLLRMAHQTYLPPAEALFRGCVPRGERRPRHRCPRFAPKMNCSVQGLLCLHAAFVGRLHPSADGDHPRKGADRERAEHCLQVADELAPNIFPPFPEWKTLDLYASLSPAKEVGGDLYDFFIRDGNCSSPWAMCRQGHSRFAFHGGDA